MYCLCLYSHSPPLLQYIARGVFRGCGMQMQASIAMAVVYYVIALPIGIPLMFLTPLDVLGQYNFSSVSTRLT